MSVRNTIKNKEMKNMLNHSEYKHLQSVRFSILNYKFSSPLFFLFIVFCIIHTTSIAQISNSSPYSRYGIGDLSGKGYAQGFAMGGTNIAMQTDTTPMFFINSGNPASYSNIRLTTAELGVNFNSIQLQNSSATKTVNNASVGYVSLAFPITKWWGSSIGLTPYSTVGYKVSDHQDINTVSGVDFLYQGSGGVNQIYWGNGIKPLYALPRQFLLSKRHERLEEEKKYSKINRILNRKKSLQALSVGANASYMFGNYDNSRRAIFPYGVNLISTLANTTTRVGGVYLDYGAQYSYTFDSIRGRDLKENVKLLFGATFATQMNVNAKIDSLSYTYITNSQGYEIGKDTIQNSIGTKGKLKFPLSFGFGFGIQKGDRWLFAADFAIQNWSNYTAFNVSENLKNSTRISLGAQYLPNSRASGLNNYYKRIYYRMGIRYQETLLDLANTQLTEKAISFGLGFPVGRNYLLQNFSVINIGVEVGQRGTISNGLIKEQFFRATLGFTINDKWFVKPKFN